MSWSGSCSVPVSRVVSCSESAFGDGQGESSCEVMMRSMDPDMMLASVFRRSALASGSSSSVVAEWEFLASSIWEWMFQNASSAERAWFRRGSSEMNQTRDLLLFFLWWWAAAAMMNERPECLSVSARHSGAISDEGEAGWSAWLRSEFSSAWVSAWWM